MNTNKVKAISDVIEKNQRVFKIPVYQRNYDWDIEQCQKLFEDIIEASKKKKKHFLGTFVYIKGNVDNSNLSEVLIIDGQQRFTTLYILLKALHDSAEKMQDEEICKEIQEYIYNRRCPEEFKIKLKPIQTDDIQLQRLMENKHESMSLSSNIKRNFNFFMECIKESKDCEIKDILDGMKQLEMVEIILDKSEGDEPQVIFESINSTGLELTLADLIRNFLLMDDDDQDYLFREYWLEIEQEIGYEEIEEFFIQYLNSKVTKDITKKNAYEKFKEYFKDNFKRHEDILKELKKYSKYYAAFVGKNSAYSREIQHLLEGFRALKQTTSYSFLFRIFEEHEDEMLSSEDLAKILSFLRSYSIRRIICEVPSNSLKGLYRGLYDRLHKTGKDKNISYTKIVRLFSELRTKDRIPSDEEFKTALMYNNLYKKIACKYILAEIENNAKEKIDLLNLTVEHILPQKINATTWKNEVGDDYDKVYEKYLHTLGNLTISGYNSELGAKSFCDKKKILMQNSKANILNREIMDASVWNEQSILRRAEVLSDNVLRIFDYKRVEICSNAFDDIKLFNLDNKPDLTNTTPRKFTFLGEETEVNSYAELLSKFMELLYDKYSDMFKRLSEQEYRMTNADSVYISYDFSKMRKPKEIFKTGIYYESNLSSEYIMIFIKNLMEKSENEMTDFEFEIW